MTKFDYQLRTSTYSKIHHVSIIYLKKSLIPFYEFYEGMVLMTTKSMDDNE